MSEPKKIYCPKCKRKITTYDGKSSSPVVRNCDKCKKRIIYYPDSEKIEIKRIPPRNTSSGITFM